MQERFIFSTPQAAIRRHVEGAHDWEWRDVATALYQWTDRFNTAFFEARIWRTSEASAFEAGSMRIDIGGMSSGGGAISALGPGERPLPGWRRCCLGSRSRPPLSRPRSRG